MLKLCYEYEGGEEDSKDDFAAAVRAHYTAVEATKSPHGEEADEVPLCHEPYDCGGNGRRTPQPVSVS